MKLHLLSFFCLLTSLSIIAQDNYNFTGLQGLKSDNGDVVFEFRGYDIAVSSISGNLSSDTLINRFKEGNVIADYADSNINLKNRIVESEIILNNEIDNVLNRAVYLFEQSLDLCLFIQFQTYNQRDIIFEKAFVKAFLKKELDAYIGSTWSASTIDFLGQSIQLGSECMWTKPHAVECGDARISWSEFVSLEDAVLDIDNRIRIYDTDIFIIVEEDDIEVVFEGVSTIARRIVFRNVKEMDEPYQISYYLAQRVGTRHVSCVLTNPAYNKKEYGLSSLLQQLMSIPELPEDAYLMEESDYIESYDNYLSSPEFEIQAGSWLPLGQLKNVFSYAPTLGFVLKFPVKHEFSIGLGVQLGLPLDKQKFEYKMDNRYYETESDFLFGVSLRCAKSKTFSKNYQFSTYLGVGMNALQTDVEKWNYDEDKEEIQSVSTVDVFGGMNFRYRKLSVFAEYHYTPYNIQSKVGSHFGHSALNVGLAYSIVWK